MKKLILISILLCLMATLGATVLATTHYEICDYYLSTWTRRVPHEVEVRTRVYMWLYDREDTTVKVDSVAVDSVGYFCFDVNNAGEYWAKADGKWFKKYTVQADSVVGGEVYLDSITTHELTLGNASYRDGALLINVLNKSGGVMNVGDAATWAVDTCELESHLAKTEGTTACTETLEDSVGYWHVGIRAAGTPANDSVTLFGTTLSGVTYEHVPLIGAASSLSASTNVFSQVDSFTLQGGGSACNFDSIRIYAIPFMMITDAASAELEFAGLVASDSIASDAMGKLCIFGICWAKVDGDNTDMVMPGEWLGAAGSRKLNEVDKDTLRVATALGTADASDDSIKVMVTGTQ